MRAVLCKHPINCHAPADPTLWGFSRLSLVHACSLACSFSLDEQSLLLFLIMFPHLHWDIRKHGYFSRCPGTLTQVLVAATVILLIHISPNTKGHVTWSSSTPHSCSFKPKCLFGSPVSPRHRKQDRVVLRNRIFFPFVFLSVGKHTNSVRIISKFDLGESMTFTWFLVHFSQWCINYVLLPRIAHCHVLFTESVIYICSVWFYTNMDW